MHSSSFDTKSSKIDGDDVLVSIATLVTESRLPGGSNTKSKKFYEGPHCPLIKGANKGHICDLNNSLCLKFEDDRQTILNLCRKNLPLSIEVLLTCACKEVDANGISAALSDVYVLEQWQFSIGVKRNSEPLFFNLNQLVSAIRSQLYFSQITAWLTIQDENSPFHITEDNIRHHISAHGKTFATPKFHLSATKHDFPATDIGDGLVLNVSFFSLPRTTNIPSPTCSRCCSKQKAMYRKSQKNGIVDDRMHTSCTLKGKHRCEDFEEDDSVKMERKLANIKRLCQNNKKCGNGPCEASTSKPRLKVNIERAQLYSMNYSNLQRSDLKNEKRNISPNLEQKLKSAKLDVWEDDCHKNDLKTQDKAQLLLDAIERSGKSTKEECVLKPSENKSESDTVNCDMSDSDIRSIRQKNKFNIYVDKHCDSPIPILTRKKIGDTSGEERAERRSSVRQKIDFGEADREKKSKELAVEVPSPSEQAKFRKNLDNAASMVFHSRTGLPLTSSPAPVRRGKSCFDFDSSITSVSAIKSDDPLLTRSGMVALYAPGGRTQYHKNFVHHNITSYKPTFSIGPRPGASGGQSNSSALFSSSFSTDDESESEGSIVSPCSPETYVVPKKEVSPVKYRRKGHAANLLGSFEESVLNGRLEPVSTVHGFTAELGASGSFVPKHLIVPVTVFFYTLGDNDKVSSPYLGHINLGKKGYNVPKSGTVQLTLFNPLGTVVKMFVIMYDLSDMPPNSQTFIRQRTLYMPTNCQDANLEWGPKWLRYLIHLRFMSSKSGKIYLHSDIRMIIFRKCDMDTATAHGIDMSYELRSFTHMPTNPRFSPRK